MSTLLDEKMIIFFNERQKQIKTEEKKRVPYNDVFTPTNCGSIGCSGFCGNSCSRHCGGKCSSVTM